MTGKGYGAECDLWSVGVINYVLFCSTTPFSGDTPADTCKNVAKGVYTYPDYVGVSQEAKAFISGLVISFVLYYTITTLNITDTG